MICRYAIAMVAILLVSCSCTPGAPVSTPYVSENRTPVTLTTPDSTSRPSPSESVPRMTIDELLQKIESNADILIVDTRIDVEKSFASGHIKGAIPVNLMNILSGEWIPPADKEIVIYCT
jgi:hypothetical protein